MKLRAVVAALIAGFNAQVEELEKLMSEDGDAEEPEEKPARRSRTSRKDEEEDEPEEKPARRSRAKKEEEEEPEDDDADADGDNPSEDDIVDAVRAAQKVLEKDDVVAVIRKYGKKDRASQVPADRRQAVIDALEKAVDDAK